MISKHGLCKRGDGGGEGGYIQSKASCDSDSQGLLKCLEMLPKQNEIRFHL